MIQRIQTLYLLLAAILVVTVNFFPLAHCQQGAEVCYTMTSIGVDSTGAPFPGAVYWSCFLPACSFFALLLIIMAVFGYKNRVVQMRRCVYAILVLLVYYVFFGIQIWTMNDVTGIFPDLALVAELPLIAIVFVFLAGRAIKRDEDLVRSMDRLR